MIEKFSKEELESIKTTYFNILALLLNKESIKSKYFGCLLKWGMQLELSSNDLHYIEHSFNHLKFEMPETNLEKINAMFDLVYMIYLDNIVEDIELEVAAHYAEHLGFHKSIVGELFQSIATAPFDGKGKEALKKELSEFLKSQNY